MFKIPNVIPLEPDELLYSWQQRLARVNGFDTIYEFARTFIYPKCPPKELADRRVMIDGREDFFPFAKALGLTDERQFAQLYLHTTLFNAVSPFMSKIQQLQLAQTAYPKNEGRILRKQVKPIFTSLQLCPQCRESELQKNGFYYYHRAHQVPGVKVCHIHSCYLIDETEKVVSTDPITDYSLGYAAFAAALLKSQTGASLETTKENLRAFFGTTLSSVRKKMLPLSDLYSKNAARSLTTQRVRIGTTDGITMAIQAFGTPEVFLSAVGAEIDGVAYLINLWKNDRIIFNAFQTHIQQPRTAASFAAEVSDIVGDEYQVVQFTGENTVLLHQACGSEQHYSVADFLRGIRCKKCTKQMSNTQFASFVETNSGKRYTFDGYEGPNLSCIHDQITGKTLVMSTDYVIQELQRPTPSTVLPHDSVNSHYSHPPTKSEDILSYIQSKYANDDIFFLEDLEVNDIPYCVLKNTVSGLCKDGTLIRLDRGIIAFPGWNHSSEEILAAKYINRNGHVIGYYYGKSFAHQLGLISDKPSMPYIVTNKESSSHGRTVSFLGEKIHLRCGVVTIDDQNYRILQFLDLLPNWTKYSQLSHCETFAILHDYAQSQNFTLDTAWPYLGFYASWVKTLYCKLIGERKCDAKALKAS